MARRRGNSIQVAVIQFIALFVLGMVFVPAFRLIGLWVALLSIMGFCAFVLSRHSRRRSNLNPWANSQSVASCKTEASTDPAQPTSEDKLHALDWFQFEKLVAAVYQQQGYAVERRGGANPDGGVDLVVCKDGITSAIQCKHWKSWKVGVKQVREFLGAMADHELKSGSIVTLQHYTNEAKEFAARHRISLVGENELLQMLESVNWQSNTAITSILNDSRKVCPRCESGMILRTAKRGRSIGNQFWGCSTYPRCKFTLQALG
jgi:HJR/Mrr/RecB family endonuclease